MDILEFINTYWQVLAFIGLCIVSWVKFSSDLSNHKIDTKAQKEEHDKQIVELKTDVSTLEAKFESHKDKISDSMNLIQQDIREIMTILKKQ